MKIKPKIYAELLLEAIKEKADSKKVAANFWHILQKNKQYKNMSRILELLDQEYAKKNGMILAKVFSETELDEATIAEIKTKVEERYSSNASEKSDSSRQCSNNKIIIRNIVKENWGGITVQVDDKIVDLSVLGRIIGLKRKLNE